jgi:hypothetical protein
MVRIKRWVVGKRKKVVWSEPQLPPFVKINPESPPGYGEGQQPGDLTMGAVMEEFLQMDEGEGELALARLTHCPALSPAALLPCLQSCHAGFCACGQLTSVLMASIAARRFSAELA